MKISEVFLIPLFHTPHLVPQQGLLLAFTLKYPQNLVPSHLLHHGHLEPPTRFSLPPTVYVHPPPHTKNTVAWGCHEGGAFRSLIIF